MLVLCVKATAAPSCLKASAELAQCEMELQQAQASHDIEKQATLLTELIAHSTRQANYAKAQLFAEQFSALEQQEIAPETQVQGLRRVAIMHYRMGQMILALNTFQRAFDLANSADLINYKAKTLADLGTTYVALNRLDQALQAQTQSLSIKQSVNDQQGMAVTYNSIGHIYQKMQQWQQALEYFQLASSLFESLSLPNRVAHTQENLGNVMQSLERPRKAIEVYQSSLTQMKAAQDLLGQLRLHNLLAQAWLQLANQQQQSDTLSRAENHLTQAQAFNKMIGTNALSAKLMQTAGRIAFAKQDWPQAHQHFEASFNLAREQQNIDTQQESLLWLINTQKQNNNWQQAHSYQQQLTQLMAHQHQRNSSRNLAISRAEFEYQQQQQAIESLQQQKKIQQLTIQSQQSRFHFWVVALSSASLLLLFFFTWIYRRRRQLETQLQQQQDFHRQQLTQLGLSNAYLSAAFSQLSEPALVIDAHNQVLFANQAMAELLKRDKHQLIQRNLQELLPLEQQDTYNLSQVLDTADDSEANYQLQTTSGSFNGMSIRIAPLSQQDALLLVFHSANQAPAVHLDEEALKQQFRESLVALMLLCVTNWEQSTQSSKVELAEKSRIWRVSIDDGRLRTRSLDRYLNLQKMPKNPRWREVLRTAHFVLAECQLDSDNRRQIDEQLQACTQLVKDLALT